MAQSSLLASSITDATSLRVTDSGLFDPCMTHWAQFLCQAFQRQLPSPQCIQNIWDTLSTSELLGKFRSIWVCFRLVIMGALAYCLSFPHGPCCTCLGSGCKHNLSIPAFVCSRICNQLNCHCWAVYIFPANHAQKATAVEVPPIAPHDPSKGSAWVDGRGGLCKIYQNITMHFQLTLSAATLIPPSQGEQLMTELT